MFENENKKHLKQELEDLPKDMENPYQILKRFINWEIMDLEAIMETCNNRTIMEKKRVQLTKDRQSHTNELKKLQKGNTIKSTF